MTSPHPASEYAARLARVQQSLADTAQRLKVPGVAIGIYADGSEEYLYHGVTSIENPLSVDEHTLFQLGSIGKTYTATALMVLAERREIDLDAPVRTYIPELRLKDESVAERVTVLQLLNHTAGWVGDVMRDTGDGDDALERYVAELATVDQIHPLGSVASYNNAAVNLAGRVIEKVAKQTYEAAVQDLLFTPLELNESFFFLKDVVTRRFVVGHEERQGKTVVARPWGLARSGNPAGGVLATAHDAIAYARFHLGDGCTRSGLRILSPEALHRMWHPTVPFGSGHVGISWMIEDIDGVTVIHHGGSTPGQHAELRLVPERNLAVSVLTNADAGHRLHAEIADLVFEHYLGLARLADEPLVLEPAALAAYAGSYDGSLWIAEIAVEEDHLRMAITFTEKGVEELRAAGMKPPQWTPARVQILSADRFLILDGEYTGVKGNFLREGANIAALNLGRVAPRRD